MTIQKAKELLQAKLTCLELDTDIEGCGMDCLNCEYNYTQGTIGEQKEVFKMAIKALEEQGAIERIVKSLEQFRKPAYKDEYGNNVANIESVFSIIKEEVERHEVD